ncbi:MAG: hypothetical protein QN189_10725 [Armatimonadota bacterium]|nr:hypothetical protein [Armatimonadota bacterium]
MDEGVAILGVGVTPLRPISPELSQRELIFEAATKAYIDAGTEPAEIHSFISISEDFHEGTSITDEYTPDQLGAILRPVHTIAGDGLQGLAAACMLIQSGIADLVAVEGHCKTSNILNHEEVFAMALDPIYERPVGVPSHAIAALEMRRYLHETGLPEEAVAGVVVKNRRNALRNPLASYGASLTVEEVQASPLLASPLRVLHTSPYADGAVVLIVASAARARRKGRKPVWIKGIGWATETPWLAERSWGRATYTVVSAQMAYRMAGISRPRKEIHFAEVDDTYAYKELQHLQALELLTPQEATELTRGGDFEGPLPVNASGGSLGMGYCFDATALYRVAEATWQIRGEAGSHQVPGARTGVVCSWRGVPTTTGGVVVLQAD